MHAVPPIRMSEICIGAFRACMCIFFMQEVYSECEADFGVCAATKLWVMPHWPSNKLSPLFAFRQLRNQF